MAVLTALVCVCSITFGILIALKMQKEAKLHTVAIETNINLQKSSVASDVNQTAPPIPSFNKIQSNKLPERDVGTVINKNYTDQFVIVFKDNIHFYENAYDRTVNLTSQDTSPPIRFSNSPQSIPVPIAAIHDDEVIHGDDEYQTMGHESKIELQGLHQE